MTKTAWSPLQIVWFKRDLRVSDHRPLAMAAVQGPVLPLFVVEPALWRQVDMSARQWAFVRECLAELSDSLACLGQPLIIRTGDVADVLQDLHESHGVAALWSHEETGNAWTYMRDKRIAGWTRLNAGPWHEVRQTGCYSRIERPERMGCALGSFYGRARGLAARRAQTHSRFGGRINPVGSGSGPAS